MIHTFLLMSNREATFWLMIIYKILFTKETLYNKLKYLKQCELDKKTNKLFGIVSLSFCWSQEILKGPRHLSVVRIARARTFLLCGTKIARLIIRHGIRAPTPIFHRIPADLQKILRDFTNRTHVPTNMAETRRSYFYKI